MRCCTLVTPDLWLCRTSNIWRHRSYGVFITVKIRLACHGAKKRPYYRVVVADGRMPASYIEVKSVVITHWLAQRRLISTREGWRVGSKGRSANKRSFHLIEIARTGAPVAEKKTALQEGTGKGCRCRGCRLRLLPQLLRSPGSRGWVNRVWIHRAHWGRRCRSRHSGDASWQGCWSCRVHRL